MKGFSHSGKLFFALYFIQLNKQIEKKLLINVGYKNSTQYDVAKCY